ncbi:hypothetical protein FRZ06_13400 [Anoxybacterium hadale]|uniref:Uncharacterized protein n=1 Tax=Anoxybacterium hadale TaxID=3408580 RepID=A0ACD1ACP0_9FIRM|nr:hypothetical protein FRZ06_13400 [Clostridiales bacterium]
MIPLPDEIVHIIQTIEAAGFEAYAVGGCVRDSILGRQAEDWDLTTNAARENLASLFPDAEIINKKLGVMRITEGGITADVAAYRIDGEYIDYRRPETVIFTRNLSEDLERRDFTMNAIAVSPFRGEVDLYQGRDDIASRTIRGIGEPGVRFEEDALRILRGIRFSAQLGFHVEPETLGAMKEKAELLSHISLERVLDEFCKTISSGSCSKGLKLLSETGAWRYILGKECFCHATATEWKKLSLLGEGIDHTKEDLSIRLGLIYLCFQKENGRRAIEYPGYANRMKQRLLLAVEKMDELQEIGATEKPDRKMQIEEGKVRLKRLIFRIGMDGYEYLETVSLAQSAALGLSHADSQQREEMLRQITEHQEPIFLSDLAVSGKDLLLAGAVQGAELGELLQILLDWVHENPEENRKARLMELAMQRIET